MPPTRLEALVKLGIATHTQAIKQRRASHALLEAIAAMIDKATAKGPPRPRIKVDAEAQAKLPFGPGDVFKALEESCTDVIQLRPYEARTFGQFGKALCGVQGLEAEDLPRVVAWIQSGGLSTWPTQVTWMHVVRHFCSAWIPQARAWEAAGGQANPSAMLTTVYR